MADQRTRDNALAILRKYIQGETLIRHCLTVEGVMRHFAELNGADADEWGLLGLLHDLDFELYPEAHCVKVVELLKAEGFSDDFIHSVQSHGFGLCCDVEPVSRKEWALYTIDELTGLVYAAALMRPSKSVLDLETKSVMKKFKAPAFAANVDRDVIRNGAEKLGIPLETVIAETIQGMRKIADEIGLRGAVDGQTFFP